MRKLSKSTIVQWSQIEKQFSQANVLLGNGFSLNFTGHFNYISLFKEFLKKCNRKEKDMFEKFETSNFESIMEKLSNTLSVNKIFNIEHKQIETAIERLRVGLITAIQENHPKYNQIDKDQLDRIALQLSNFNDVFTLNYDLFLYHIIMKVLDNSRINKKIKPYSDYFWGVYDPGYKKFEDFQNYDYKLLYYLHGALFIFEQSYDLTVKLKRGGDDAELIDLIENNINDDWVPLYVSEGLSEEKMETINSNAYLQFAREKFRNSNKNLVIFGCSLSPSDNHIVNAIQQNKNELAISIHVDGKTDDELIRIQQRYVDTFPNHNILFYDSTTLFRF